MEKAVKTIIDAASGKDRAVLDSASSRAPESRCLSAESCSAAGRSVPGRAGARGVWDA